MEKSSTIELSIRIDAEEDGDMVYMATTLWKSVPLPYYKKAQQTHLHIIKWHGLRETKAEKKKVLFF